MSVGRSDGSDDGTLVVGSEGAHDGTADGVMDGALVG